MEFNILFLLFIFILYYISNYYILNNYRINNDLNKEHFINFYQYINDSLNPKIKENNLNQNSNIIQSNSLNEMKKNEINNIFLKNIYLSYTKKENIYNFYMFNYSQKLYMKVIINKKNDYFNIYDIHKKKLGFLIKKKHNKYIIDLNKLYKNNYIYAIENNYQQIKIYSDFEYNVYYLKKNDDPLKKYKLYLFDDEIGYINNDNSNFKFYIKNNFLKYINLFGYGLIIIIINNENKLKI